MGDGRVTTAGRWTTDYTWLVRGWPSLAHTFVYDYFDTLRLLPSFAAVEDTIRMARPHPSLLFWYDYIRALRYWCTGAHCLAGLVVAGAAVTSCIHQP